MKLSFKDFHIVGLEFEQFLSGLASKFVSIETVKNDSSGPWREYYRVWYWT